jgi:hypothetical protein
MKAILLVLSLTLACKSYTQWMMNGVTFDSARKYSLSVDPNSSSITKSYDGKIVVNWYDYKLLAQFAVYFNNTHELSYLVAISPFNNKVFAAMINTFDKTTGSVKISETEWKVYNYNVYDVKILFVKDLNQNTFFITRVE